MGLHWTHTNMSMPLLYQGAQIWTHQHTTPDVLSPGLWRGEGSTSSASWLQSDLCGQAQDTEYLQGQRMHTTPGKLVPMFDHSNVKKFSCLPTQKLLYSNFEVSRLGKTFMLKLENTSKTGSHLCTAKIALIFMVLDTSSLFLMKK